MTKDAKKILKARNVTGNTNHTKMAILNSNPEVLLRKRKDKDRKRLQKQEEVRLNQLKRQRAQKRKNQKFVRAETLVSNNKSKQLERKRVKNINKYEKQQAQKNLGVSDVEISTTNDANNNIDTDDQENEKLLFVIRIPDHTKGLKMPSKVDQVLKVLRLQQVNNGVFIKLNKYTSPLIKLITPYVVYGQPSLNSIRQLFQKRASIKDPESPDKTIKLDNNQLVEDQFEDLGLICIEDLIQELISLSDNVKVVSNWLAPFKLNLPVTGFGPQSKLAKLKLEQLNHKSISLSGNINLNEVDIDKVIDEQN